MDRVSRAQADDVPSTSLAVPEGTEVNEHRVDSVEALERLYAAPLASSVAKELPALNAHYRRLIEASPFLTIASTGPGGLDCSPRGDAPGFVAVLDERTLAIPDRRGNNRLDTLRNVVVDPRVALLFMIPGVEETLRVNGRAHLSTEDALLARFHVDGKRPVTAIVVGIERVYFQCARALKRSGLWDPARHVDPGTLPSAGTLIRSAIADFDAGAYDAELAARQARTLW